MIVIYLLHNGNPGQSVFSQVKKLRPHQNIFVETPVPEMYRGKKKIAKKNWGQNIGVKTSHYQNDVALRVRHQNNSVLEKKNSSVKSRTVIKEDVDVFQLAANTLKVLIETDIAGELKRTGKIRKEKIFKVSSDVWNRLELTGEQVLFFQIMETY